MSYPFIYLAATPKTASQHPCRFSIAAAAVAAPFLFINPALAALNCTTQPTCTELGYSKADVDNCDSYVFCPFDTSYKACIKTGENIDCPGYTLSKCPENAICSSCMSGTTQQYKIDSCYQGYVISGNSCVLQCSAGYEPHDDSVPCSDIYGCSSYLWDPNNEWCSTCSKKTCPITSPYCSKAACQKGGNTCIESTTKGCYARKALVSVCSDGYTENLFCKLDLYGCTIREIDPVNSDCAKCVTSSCPSDYPYCDLSTCQSGGNTCTKHTTQNCYKRNSSQHKCCDGLESGATYYYCVDADKCLEGSWTSCPQDPDTGLFPRPVIGTCP